MIRLAKFFLLILSFACLANASFLWLTASPNFGLYCLTALGAAILLYAIFLRGIHRLLHNRFGTLIRAVVLLAACLVFFISALITVSGQHDTVRYDEDALIVLGAGLHEDVPSRPLRYRLDKAVQYHKINPDAYLVVSGGQGAYEAVTEAEAMRRYLLEQGVDASKIICETNATSTRENFMYSKQLLDELCGSSYKTAYVTNSFHIYRAGRLAKSVGLQTARLIAPSDWTTLLADYLRECCAVVVMWIHG